MIVLGLMDCGPFEKKDIDVLLDGWLMPKGAKCMARTTRGALVKGLYQGPSELLGRHSVARVEFGIMESKKFPEPAIERGYVPMECYHTWPAEITEGWEEQGTG